MQNYTDQYIESLECADDYARSFGMDKVEPVHLLLGVLCISESRAAKAFKEAGVTRQWVKDVIDEAIGNVPLAVDFMDELEISKGAEKVLTFADNIGRLMDEDVDVDHIALGLLKKSGLHADLITLRVPPQEIYDSLFNDLLFRAKEVVANQVTIEDL